MSSGQTPRPNILVVEDDPGLAVALRDRLEAGGYQTWRAETAAEALAMADELKPALFILDLMLPDMHGLVLCANIREKSSAPIIICSGTKRKDDPVLAFKLGAIDFIGKPFAMDELEARVEAALRRSLHGSPNSAKVSGIVALGQLAIDDRRRRVTLGDQVIKCTPTEYRLLCLLATRPNTVISRDELAEKIWGLSDRGIRRSLDVHLRRLRAKLTAGSEESPSLIAVRGFGYQLVWEPEQAGNRTGGVVLA